MCAFLLLLYIILISPYQNVINILTSLPPCLKHMENRQQLLVNKNISLQNVENSQRTSQSKITYLLERILQRMKILHSRHRSCRHSGSCIGSLVYSSLRTGIIVYGIKVLIHLLFSLRKIVADLSSLKKIVIDILVEKQTIKAGIAMTSFVAIFRMFLCSIRRLTSQNNQKYVFFIAGLISGVISILFLQKPTRQALCLFLIVRALDISYHSLVNKGYLPQWRYFYIFLYSTSMMVTGYCFYNEPGCLSQKTHNFYKSFTSETISEMQIRQIAIERKNIQLMEKGIKPQNPLVLMPRLDAYYRKLKM